MVEPLFAIVNPSAGGGRCGKRCGEALAHLRDSGLQVEAVSTTQAGHATELAREAYAAGRRRFLAVGGDGTAHEVLNGIFPRPETDREPVVFGLLPLGTGNSFLRDFGIDGPLPALEALIRGDERPCDVVRVDHAEGTLHYMNLLSVGFSARAGELTNARFKGLGTAGYVAAVLACVARLEHPVIPVRLDGGEVDRRPLALLSFCNSRYTGGSMMMAPEAEVADGLLDVIRVGMLGRARFVANFPRIFRGTHVGRRGIEQARARRVELVDVGPMPAMVDGEIVTLELRSLEVLPAALRVIA